MKQREKNPVGAQNPSPRRRYDQDGPKNNAWRGGSSPEYYRRVCFETWGRCCFGCGREAILAHHRDRDRANNAPSNLTPLCKRCHQLLHKADLNLPTREAGPIIYRDRMCPGTGCTRMFTPSGPRGRCADCTKNGIRAVVKFRDRVCSKCGRPFTPDAPARKRCSPCSPRAWAPGAAGESRRAGDTGDA